ncbi:MAG: glutamate--tRNA ligase family protein [Nocardioidaceae bacterium]
MEDTDAARDSEGSYAGLLDSLRWLGLDWDEGPEVGGEHGPYRQSSGWRSTRTWLPGSLGGGAPTTRTTPRGAGGAAQRGARGGRASGYDGLHRDLSDEQRAAFEAEGRRPVVRFRMPDQPITFTDLVRGEVTFEPEHVSDYVLVRANGQPLYTLTNPVDDATMGITHVLRGEDLLSSTPRQIPLHRGDGPDRCGGGDRAGVRAPAVRHGGGQPQAVQARSRRRAGDVPRAGVPA